MARTTKWTPPLPVRRRIVGLEVSAGTFGDDYRMQVYQGILLYAREHAAWKLVLNDSIYPMPHKFVNYQDLLAQGAEGLLFIGSPRLEPMGGVQAVLDTGLCAVNIANVVDDHRLPSVETDDHAIGALAADHFLRRGYQSFGICGIARERYLKIGRGRADGFTEEVTKRGFPCVEHGYPLPLGRDERSDQAEADRLKQWLRSLPNPAAVFAIHDNRAVHVLEACAELKLKVPIEVGVIGVDNSKFLCETRYPTLSSVDPDFTRIGYEAAALLDRMMSGQPPPTAPILIKPKEIVTRMSTDILSVDDEVVARALIFIREHLAEPFSIEDVVHASGVSHSSLERRFRSRIGHTMSREIRLQRIEKAKQLLRETVLSLKEIAEETGFRRVTYLTNVFTLITGLPPHAWRKQNRLMH